MERVKQLVVFPASKARKIIIGSCPSRQASHKETNASFAMLLPELM
jgi:hypothetical protein